ncbi:MAG: ketoacyl-ACP synthase III [Planctomycetales bacterium]|nr:ketoacyl-ACP synthase III [Planctomycetales bacterium]
MGVELKPVGQSRIWELMGVQVLGTGSFVPDNVVRNEDLARLGYDDDWILQRTGIRERRHAPPEMATSHMAIEAGRRCIEDADVDPDSIDLLVLATLTPDRLMPATACTVQHGLGLRCPAFDVMAACAGFLYALTTGMQYVAAGCSQRALIIGSDTNSRIMNPKDKKTYPLFGDGAGAVLLGPGSPEQGAKAFTMGSDGFGDELLWRPKGGSREPYASCVQDEGHYVSMEGRPVFKWAVRLLDDTSRQVVAHAGLELSDIDLWVFHQANARILDAAAQNLGIDSAKVIKHVDRYGNTSGASVPIALDESRREGRIQPGSTLLISGFGAGLAWGTTVFRW